MVTPRASTLPACMTTDPCQRAVNKGGRATAAELIGVGVDVLVLGKHADVRHLDVIEEQETVVHGVVAELGADITNVDVRERLVGLHVADLDNEGGRAVGFALDNELSHDHGVVGGAAEGADPPLAGSQVWGVDGKGLIVLVPCCCSLESTDVGSVTQLGLGVTSDDLVVLGLGEPLLLLLFGTLSGKCDLVG
jgi:hypothetical protein